MTRSVGAEVQTVLTVQLHRGQCYKETPDVSGPHLLVRERAFDRNAVRKLQNNRPMHITKTYQFNILQGGKPGRSFGRLHQMCTTTFVIELVIL